MNSSRTQMYTSTGSWQIHTSTAACALHVNHNEHSCTAAVSHPFFCLINGSDTWPWPSSCINAKGTVSSIQYLLTLPLLLGSDPGPPWQFIKEIHRHWMMEFFSTFISGRRWIIGGLRCIGIHGGECRQDPWGNQLMIEERTVWASLWGIPGQCSGYRWHRVLQFITTVFAVAVLIKVSPAFCVSMFWHIHSSA